MTTSTFSSSSVSVAIAYISGGFFLSCGKSRPRRLVESLWLASENIFNSIFCQLLVPLSLSLSVAPCHFYLPYVWRICVRADSTLLIRPAVRAVLPLAFLLRCSVCPKVKWIFWKEKKTPSLPRRNLFSAFAYFVGNFRVERSLHLCIPYHSHNDAWSTLTNILKTTQEFSSKVKRIVLRLLCRFLSLS